MPVVNTRFTVLKGMNEDVTTTNMTRTKLRKDNQARPVVGVFWLRIDRVKDVETHCLL